MNLDKNKLEPLLGKVVNEIGAASNAALVILGDKLGLFRALAEAAMTSEELAKRTQTHERYVREWLSAQAASGFVDYDAATGQFSMSPEQSAVFAKEDSPVLMVGGFSLLSAIYHDEPKLEEAFKSGQGMHWGDHCNCLFCGGRAILPSGLSHPSHRRMVAGARRRHRQARTRRKGGRHWLRARRVDAPDGGRVSQLGIVGIDYHEASIKHASAQVEERKNIRFETARAQTFGGSDYDLVTIFDALHDMGDPIGAVAHIRQALSRDGTLMLVEPDAGDGLEDNLNPVGRVYYAGSTHICVPTALNQENGLALGAQAGPRRIEDVVRSGGFTRFRQAATTPFNMILEARL